MDNNNQNFNNNYSNQGYNTYGGGGSNIPERSIVLCIILSMVTCGIYALYWLACMVNDTNAAAADNQAPSGLTVILLSIVTCGIYMIYWMYKVGERLQKAKAMRGAVAPSNDGVLYLILCLLGLGYVNYCLVQNELNKLSRGQVM